MLGQEIHDAVVHTVKAMEAEVQDHEENLMGLRRRIESANIFLREVLPATDFSSLAVSQRRYSTVREEITDAIWTLLLAERPLHRREILSRVKAAGVHVSGDAHTDEMDGIAPYLTQDSRFVSYDRRGMWTISDEHLPGPDNESGVGGDALDSPRASEGESAN